MSEFPWDMTRSVEIALFRTYCVPSISALLDKIGEFRLRPQKRYDDTGLIVTEIIKWGYDSDRRREAIRRMNYIHAFFTDFHQRSYPTGYQMSDLGPPHMIPRRSRWW